jgi:hypothetical protein
MESDSDRSVNIQTNNMLKWNTQIYCITKNVSEIQDNLEW